MSHKHPATPLVATAAGQQLVVATQAAASLAVATTVEVVRENESELSSLFGSHADDANVPQKDNDVNSGPIDSG